MECGPESEIRRLISVNGPITFAEFMETALYHPNGGYYARDRQDGAQGDYYTSPSVHPVFSALIAIHLEAVWKILGSPTPFHVVEMGAGSGLMARDISEYVREHLEPFGNSVRYIAMDRYPRRGETAPGASAETPRGVVGCVVSNELVDAFPVHRFEIRDGRLAELFVDVGEDGQLRSVIGEPSTPLLARRLDQLGVELPDGTRGEINLRIGPWTKQVAEIIERGFVVTVDYGYESEELYSTKRSRGTLQTYYRHTSGSSPYRRIGRQDITAHVDFSTIIDEGRAAGLEPAGLMTQADYLDRLGLRVWTDRLRDCGLPAREVRRNAMAMRDLANPGGLGGFKVLIQETGTGVRDGESQFPRPDYVEGLPFPLLPADHVREYGGRHPPGEWGWGNLLGRRM